MELFVIHSNTLNHLTMCKENELGLEGGNLILGDPKRLTNPGVY